MLEYCRSITARSVFAFAVVYLISVGLTGVSGAGTETRSDRLIKEIAAMDLEGLLSTKVTLGARTPEEWFRSASAIYVITQEDIRRSGMTEVPELLRMVPGVHVAKIDASKWAVSIRGFNERFSSKLLVLLDGRIAYTPLFSGVYWDVHDVILEDIERIEVIRGPGAALWGSNAVNGVINIITRGAGDTHGGLVSASAGDGETDYRAAVRYGFQKNQFHLRAYAKYAEQESGEFLGGDLSENDGYFTPGTRAHDGWRQWHAGFRGDWDVTGTDRISFFGDIYDGEFGRTRLVSGMAGTTVDRDPTSASGGYGVARWKRTFSKRSDLILSLYFDHNCRKDASLDETRDTYTADFQHRYTAGRHELMWGLEGRSTRDELVRKGAIFFDPPERTLNRVTSFVQDRIGFGAGLRKFALTLGSKFEHNNRTGFEYQPNVRFLWSPTDTTSLWASVSRAVRTPSRAANDLQVEIFPGTTIPAGNPDLDSEKLIAYELGARFSTFQRFYVDLVGYFNDYTDLITGTENDGKVRSAGFEVASRWQCTRRWALSACYSFIDFISIEPETFMHAAPKNTANVRSNVDLPAHFEFDAAAYYVDPAFSNIPDYTRVDLRLGWKPVSRAGIDLVLRNLFDEAHAEAPEGTQLNTAVRRSAHVTARVRF